MRLANRRRILALHKHRKWLCLRHAHSSRAACLLTKLTLRDRTTRLAHAEVSRIVNVQLPHPFRRQACLDFTHEIWAVSTAPSFPGCSKSLGGKHPDGSEVPSLQSTKKWKGRSPHKR